MKKFLFIGALGFALYSHSPANAQGGAPDMSDFQGAVAKKAEEAPPKSQPSTPKTGFSSGLTVPRTKPGQAAKAVFTALRQQTEKAAEKQPEMGQVVTAIKQLEDQAPDLLKSAETELLNKYGFATSDMGTAYAFAFMTLLESATGKETTETQDKVAGRTLSSAVGTYWAPKWKELTPAAKESMYETLIMSSALTGILIGAFDQAGKKDDVATLRASAAESFEALVGVKPQQVKISADGRITGLAKVKE